MASILNVDQINNAAGTSAVTIDPSTGKPSFPNGVTLPAGVGGKLLQVVHADPGSNGYTEAQSYFSTTSGSFVDAGAGGHYVEITPTSASSKILLMASFPVYNNASYSYYRMAREVSGTTSNLTNIGTGGNDLMALTATGWDHASFNWVDIPNTTSLIKYKMYMKVSSGTGLIGWSATANDSYFNISSYIAVEIAG